jgi:hypothetical protein
MDLGNVILLSTLSASASYVAATAAMGKLVPPQAIATTLTLSLGVTLPWNILAGIPFYTAIARSLRDINPQSILNAFAFHVLPEVIMWLGVVLMVIGAVITIVLIWSKHKAVASASEYAKCWIGKCIILIGNGCSEQLPDTVYQYLMHAISMLDEALERTWLAVLSYSANFQTYSGWRVSALTRYEMQAAFHQAFLSTTWPPPLMLATEAVSCCVPP